MTSRLRASWTGIVQAMAATAMLSGCYHHYHGSCGAKHHPHGAIPAPLGSYSCQWQELQAARADADDRVVYHADWIGDSSDLGPLARRRLARTDLASSRSWGPFLVVPSEDDRLDQQRRLAVWSYLISNGWELVEDDVVIGYPEAAGLDGPLAQEVAGRLVEGGTTGSNDRSAPFPAFGSSPRGPGPTGMGSF